MPSSGVPLLKTFREKPLNTPPCGQNYNFICFRVLASIVILGKACDLIDHHQEQKKASTVSVSSPQKTEKTEMSSATSPEASAKVEAISKPLTKSLSPRKVEEKELSLGSQVTSAEDISLLEAKLQRIDATRAFSNPSAPVLAEVNDY